MAWELMKLERERTSGAFGRAAESAVRAGFAIVNRPPFDEAQPSADAGNILDTTRRGLERVAAVRETVGSNVRVLVDCHSRFEANTAPLVAAEPAKLNLGSIEEPFQPMRESVSSWLVARVGTGRRSSPVW